MAIFSDDEFYLFGASTINPKRFVELSKLSEDVYLITSSSAISIYFFIRRHMPKKGIFFCSPRAMRLLTGIVDGSIFHIESLMGDLALHSELYRNKNKKLPKLSISERYLMDAFVKNKPATKIMTGLCCSYKTFRVVHSSLRRKLFVENDIELYVKICLRDFYLGRDKAITSTLTSVVN